LRKLERARSLLEREYFRDQPIHSDAAAAQQSERGLEPAAARTDEGDLIHDHRSGVNLRQAMHSRFQDDSSARPGEGNCLAQAYDGSRCIDNVLVIGARELTINRGVNSAFTSDRQFLWMASVLVHFCAVRMQHLTDKQAKLAIA